MEYLVIGGWAAIAHGLPRSTLDVDLFVRPTRDNVERTIGALADVGFGSARELDANDILSRHVFLFADQIRIDLFLKPWELDDFDACWARRRETELDTVRIPVLGLEDLIRSKRTDREGDRADVEALERLRRDRGPGGC